MHTPDIELAGNTKSRPLPETVDKPDTEMVENVTIILTEEDNIRVRKKTDKHILSLLAWVYFLQVIAKAVLGASSVFGLQEDAGLSGHQYSLVGSISPIAQLAWQPFSAWLIVKVRPRILMPTLVLGWGIACASIAACDNFGGLMAARFFLGLFEAGCMPLFTFLTGQWYRRVEQPFRVAGWYSMNGLSTMAASALSYGLGHIPSSVLLPWQIIFLFVGLVTIVSAPIVYWRLDDDIRSARFLTEEERLQGVERLRANQTGASTNKFIWSHIWEIILEPKSWLWLVMAWLPNMGSAMTSIFGPLIIKGLGFDRYITSLLNIPFGAVQTIVILAACWASTYVKLKSAVLLAFMVPVVAAYYLCAFLFAGNPLLLSWAVGNTSGTTKKSVTLSLYQAGLSAGDIVGPLMFSDDQAPNYRPGTAGVLGIFVALICSIIIQVAILVLLNKSQSKKRVRNGKSAVIVDQSMQNTVNSGGKVGEHVVDESDNLDLTDRQNDEFVYIY